MMEAYYKTTFDIKNNGRQFLRFNKRLHNKQLPDYQNKNTSPLNHTN